MDHNKLYVAYQNKIFSDLALTLIDNTKNKITINVHKIILYSLCPYFEKLLTNFKEKDLNNITIEVPNTYVMYDLIMSFYGQKTNLGKLSNTKHLLESIRCYDFLDLDISKFVIDNIEILEEDFELFLDVIDIIGYNDKTIKLIGKNLPKEYDLSKFPNVLLHEMLDLSKTYYYLSGSNDTTIKIWNGITHQLVDTIDVKKSSIFSLCCSPNNKFIIFGSNDGGFHEIDGHMYEIEYINTIKIFDADKKEIVKILKGHDMSINCVNCSSDSQFLVSGSSDCTAKIWNLETGDLIHTLTGHLQIILDICFSFDNQQIISVSYDRSVKIWDVKTGILIETLLYHKAGIRSVSCSSDGKYIASCSFDKTIKIFDANTYELVHTLDFYKDVVCICFSLDNKQIIAGDADHQIKICDVESGTLINTLTNHNSDILSICYSPDNKYIISGNFAHSIKIWDAKTYKLVNTLTEHTGYVHRVCCSSFVNMEVANRIMKYFYQ